MSHCLHEWLEEAGYEVEEWLPRSATEVPDHIRDSAPDLILADFQMPGCNGGTLARMAKTIAPKTPVLILTAFRTREMERELLKLGVRQVLAKPIKGEALTYAVMGALAAPP